MSADNLNVLSKFTSITNSVCLCVFPWAFIQSNVLSSFPFQFTDLLFLLLWSNCAGVRNYSTYCHATFNIFNASFVSATSLSNVERLSYSCLGNSIVFYIYTDFIFGTSLQVALLLAFSSGSLKVLNVFKNGKQKFYIKI